MANTLDEKIYSLMVQLYPEQYQQKFQQPMAQLYRDLKQEALVEHGRLGVVRLWAALLFDFVTSFINQLLTNYMKNEYGNFNLVMIGIILILPFSALVGFDMVAKLAGYADVNNIIGIHIAHHVVVATFIFLIMPLLALLLNLIPLLTNLPAISFSAPGLMHFVRQNLFHFIVAAAAFLALAFMLGHDAVHCFFSWNFWHAHFRQTWECVRTN